MRTLFENTNSFSRHTPRFWVVGGGWKNTKRKFANLCFYVDVEYNAARALGISIHTTVCVLWSFDQCDIDGVFHRWMAVSISLSVLVIPLPTVTKERLRFLVLYIEYRIVYSSIGYLHTHYCMCLVVVLSMRYWRSVSSLDGCVYITLHSGNPTSHSHKGKVTLSCLVYWI